VASLGKASGNCAKDKVNVEGETFELTALKGTGGPVIKIAKYTTSCTSSNLFVQAQLSFSGVSGIQLPQRFEEKHTITVSTSKGVAAKLVFNDITRGDKGLLGMTAPANHLVQQRWRLG